LNFKPVIVSSLVVNVHAGEQATLGMIRGTEAVRQSGAAALHGTVSAGFRVGTERDQLVLKDRRARLRAAGTLLDFAQTHLCLAQHLGRMALIPVLDSPKRIEETLNDEMVAARAGLTLSKSDFLKFPGKRAVIPFVPCSALRRGSSTSSPRLTAGI
jgi:hypothetical protein